VTEAVDASPRGFNALPTWARIGLIALAAILVALIAIVAVRLATRVPTIPFGTTAVADLRPGSCLAEAQPDLEAYTVIPCGGEHPQQVFATADLELDANTYALVDTALATFGDEVCSRYLEYRLFLRAGLETRQYTAYAIAVPDAATYAAGSTEALCALAPANGGTITGDAYRSMP
jgi:hypothetical protein